MGDGAIEQVSNVAVKLLDALEEAGIPAALGGGLAFNIWAIPRATLDVDLNLFVQPADYERALDALVSAGCTADLDGSSWDAQMRQVFLDRAGAGEVAIAWLGSVRVDVFVPSIPFYEDAERTTQRVAFAEDGKPRPVLSPEALSVFKLLFFRDKDIGDLRRLVAIQGEALDARWVRDRVVEMMGEDDPRVIAWDDIVRTHSST